MILEKKDNRLVWIKHFENILMEPKEYKVEIRNDNVDEDIVVVAKTGRIMVIILRNNRYVKTDGALEKPK